MDSILIAIGITLIAGVFIHFIQKYFTNALKSNSIKQVDVPFATPSDWHDKKFHIIYTSDYGRTIDKEITVLHFDGLYLTAKDEYSKTLHIGFGHIDAAYCVTDQGADVPIGKAYDIFQHDWSAAEKFLNSYGQGVFILLSVMGASGDLYPRDFETLDDYIKNSLLGDSDPSDDEMKESVAIVTRMTVNHVSYDKHVTECIETICADETLVDTKELAAHIVTALEIHSVRDGRNRLSTERLKAAQHVQRQFAFLRPDIDFDVLPKKLPTTKKSPKAKKASVK